MRETHGFKTYQLSHMAECGDPDSHESPGAEWLHDVAGAYEVDYARETTYPEDYLTEMADQMVPIYTHQKWKVFVDTMAYQEDTAAELGDVLDDFDKTASMALYLIAHRLLTAIDNELREDADE